MSDQPRAFTPDDITRIHWLSDAQIAPDGRRAAFVVTDLSEEQDEYRSAIWLVETAGGEPRRFTHGPKRDTAPRWSPDGTRLAFLSARDGKDEPQLYVIPADGGEPVRITDLPHAAGAPVWSPDGKRIAFVARVPETPEPTDEAEKKKSRPPRTITELRYQSNGEGFVYDRRQQLFVAPADGGEVRALTSGRYEYGAPAWTADSQSLVVVSAQHDERDYDSADDLWLLPVEGGPPRCITDTGGEVSHPAVSPDGQTIAFLGSRSVNEAGRNVRVYTIGLDGSGLTCLTPDLDRTTEALGEGRGLHWSADGQWLVFGAQDQGDVPLYRVRADGGSAPEQIIGGERQVKGVALARDGRLAFTASDPLAPAEVVTANLDGSDERRLTDCNGAWRAEVALSRPERYRFERDGFTVDGWVMRPFGFQEGRRYPALLHIHGGPMTQYGHTFFDEFQVAAGAGYGVIFTNPRGSQGYGEAFTRAVVGDWGGGDYADVMAGVDAALVQHDWIDPERLGVLGGSYGGYMTSWTVGHTDRFQAACSERAVNNLLTLFGTSDIGHFFAEQHSGFLPWENSQWYVDRSPLTYAPQITTPLLIIHSEDDIRCRVEQAEQLFVALKKQRKPVVFVRFPGEHHELTRNGRPRHRLQRFRIILDWFAEHLKP